MSEPLRLSFEVACPAKHAFRVWTAGLNSWWPRDHTVSGAPERVVLQAGVGGRIYERDADGTEHEWGEVTVWQPPERLAYLWYLGRDRAAATEVEIRFLDRGTATRVEIEHQGWERLGPDGAQWRDRNQAGWTSLLPHFAAAIAGRQDYRGDTDG
jgi:Activator of Hsp90 ATPase homolog 1-like protein